MADKYFCFFHAKIRMYKLMSSHGGFDHMGVSINLVNNFKVEKVMFNYALYNDFKKTN
jgi:hypothetical protein